MLDSAKKISVPKAREKGGGDKLWDFLRDFLMDCFILSPSLSWSGPMPEIWWPAPDGKCTWSPLPRMHLTLREISPARKRLCLSSGLSGAERQSEREQRGARGRAEDTNAEEAEYRRIIQGEKPDKKNRK